MEFICEKMGIDVRAKKMELARKMKAQIEKNIEDSKKALKDSVKKA